MKHKHDCPACVSLGEFNDHDLYFCTGPHTGNREIYHGQLIFVVRTSEKDCSAISIETIRFYMRLFKQVQHDAGAPCSDNEIEELLHKNSYFSSSEIEAFRRYNKRSIRQLPSP